MRIPKCRVQARCAPNEPWSKLLISKPGGPSTRILHATQITEPIFNPLIKRVDHVKIVGFVLVGIGRKDLPPLGIAISPPDEHTWQWEVTRGCCSCLEDHLPKWRTRMVRICENITSNAGSLLRSMASPRRLLGSHCTAGDFSILVPVVAWTCAHRPQKRSWAFWRLRPASRGPCLYHAWALGSGVLGLLFGMFGLLFPSFTVAVALELLPFVFSNMA